MLIDYPHNALFEPFRHQIRFDMILSVTPLRHDAGDIL